jgi:tRNA pseudouridine13 synthase
MNAEAGLVTADALPRANPDPPAAGRLRCRPEDFQVTETLGFEPSGEGEHAFLCVEKRGMNTDWLARQLARFAGVKPVAVGYAGLKDRDAVTRQYFTVQLPGRESPDWGSLGLEGVRVLEATRHHRKLQRGALRGNRFRLTVRELSGDRSALDERMAGIARSGVPNYFGPQRFGRGGDNRRQAERLFQGKAGRLPRAKRGMYLSAARSRLFNAVLARRVGDGTWNRGLAGEIYALEGSRAQFGPEPRSAELDQRLGALDIHPTGPMWGRGELAVSDECRALEMAVLEPFTVFREGLEAFGLKQERRALRLRVGEPDISLDDDVATVSFTLPPGTYATVVLRELINERP